MRCKPCVLPPRLSRFRWWSVGCVTFTTAIARRVQRHRRRTAWSASIAQVYKATLAESGETVAIKIRRDHVRQDMVRDIALMRRASDLLNLTGSTMIQGVDINVVIDELDRTVREEIDFNVERENLERFGRGLATEPGVTCPKAYDEYSDETVLVMGIRRRPLARARRRASRSGLQSARNRRSHREFIHAANGRKRLLSC